MRLHIRTAGIVVGDGMRAHADRRLRFVLGRFGNRVRRVAVYLADVNGIKGGVDKQCRLVANVGLGEPVVVEDRDCDFASLLDRAADRLATAISRRLDRLRSRRGEASGWASAMGA